MTDLLLTAETKILPLKPVEAMAEEHRYEAWDDSGYMLAAGKVSYSGF